MSPSLNPALRFGPPADEGQRSELIEILCQCFRADTEAIDRTAKLAGEGNLRVVASDERVLGGLWHLPMGQSFGGRVVPTVGIAGVGTDPAHRGQRAASTLMAGSMTELHEQGVPLSTLYPATLPLYRGAGYELAGDRWKICLPLGRLDLRDTEPALRSAGPDDFAAMAECYGRFARARTGYLDRCQYIWTRIREPKTGSVRHYVVEEDGRMEGYVSLMQVDGASGAFFDLSLTDAVANSPGAARRLLAFLSSHASMAGDVTLYGSALHPLVALVPEWRATVTLDLPWMLRIVNLQAALTARGYPMGLSAELHLDIADELLPGNAGPHILRIEDGVGRVEPGGHGTLPIHIRGLAALYSGRASPEDLRLSGLAQGSAQDWAAAAAVFAGTAPVMSDFF